MIIDRETFTEAAVHTKLLSDAFLSVCQKLTRLSESCAGNEEEWKGVLNATPFLKLTRKNMEKEA